MLMFFRNSLTVFMTILLSATALIAMETPGLGDTKIEIITNIDPIAEAHAVDLNKRLSLAVHYYTNSGLARNLESAEHYFRLARNEHGHTLSEIFLYAIEMERLRAEVPSFGDGFRKDCIGALEGNIEAQANLGLHYAKSELMPKKFSVAVKWLLHVVERRLPTNKDCAWLNNIHLLLAKIYYQGMGVAIDHEKALSHLKIPAKNLHAIKFNNDDFFAHFMKYGDMDKNLTLYTNYFIWFYYFHADPSNQDARIYSNYELNNRAAQKFMMEVQNFCGWVSMSKFKMSLSLIGTPLATEIKAIKNVWLDFANTGLSLMNSKSGFENDALVLASIQIVKSALIAEFFANLDGDKDAPNILQFIRKNEAIKGFNLKYQGALKFQLLDAEGNKS